MLSAGGQVVDTLDLGAQAPAATASSGRAGAVADGDGYTFRVTRHQRQRPACRATTLMRDRVARSAPPAAR